MKLGLSAGYLTLLYPRFYTLLYTIDTEASVFDVRPNLSLSGVAYPEYSLYPTLTFTRVINPRMYKSYLVEWLQGRMKLLGAQ